MAIIEWKKELEVNYPKIDEQHKKLVALINQLHDAMKSGKGKDACGEILKELADYTVYHFGTEEELMKKSYYPEAEVHGAAHKDLVQQVVDFKSKFDQGAIGLSMDLFDFLNKWLIEHIMGTDKKLGSYLKLRGI